MTQEFSVTNRINGLNRNRKIKISNKIQLLPSKILLENLVSEYNNKIHLNDTHQHKFDKARSKFNSQDKRRSKSSSDSSPNSFWDTEESFWQANQGNSCASNHHNDSPKIVVLQNITVAPPFQKKRDLNGRQSDNLKTDEKRTNSKRSVLLNLKMHFSRPPNSAPARTTAQFEFDFDNRKKGDDNFYMKKTINIDTNNARLHSKIFETENNSIYVKNKLYAENQNVRTSSTTNLRKNNFNIYQHDSFSTYEEVNANNSISDNEVIAASTSKSTLPKGIFNINYVDENQNNMPTREDQRKTEWITFRKDYGKKHNCCDYDSSSKYTSSPLNEAFFTNSSIKLDNSCQENCSQVVPSKNRDELTERRFDETNCKTDKNNYFKKNNYLQNLPYTGDIYNTEYLQEIFENIKRLEKKIVLQDGFLNEHNPDQMSRSEIVNWMLKIQHTEFCYSESEFYLAVYLLDKVLANIYIPVDLYQLLALSTIWIASKLIGIEDFSVFTMINLTRDVYSKNQLLQMEANVLNIMNFEIYTAEPSLCVCYYLKIFNLETNELARFSAFYVLDFFALLPEFSSTPMSLLAAAVINFVQNVYHKSSLNKVNILFQEILSKEDIEKIKSLGKKLYSQLNKMGDENYIFKEPYRKYEHEELMTVSKYMNSAAFK